MPISKQDIASLVALQEQDKLLDSLESSIARVPEEIASARAELESEKGRSAELKSRGTSLLLKKKEKEMELGQREEAVRKHSQDLNQVKTNEAFKALQSEIDKAKAEASSLETDILTIMEESDQLAREEKALAAELKGIEARVNERVAVIEKRKVELESRRDAQAARRAELSGQLPGELLSQYEQIRKRRQGIAMARVEANTCTVCRMSIRPQVVVDLAKGTSLMTCDSCQRILYTGSMEPARQPT